MRSLRQAVFGLLVGAPACSALLDEQLVIVHCDVDDAYGPPGCPEQQTCVEGTCREVGLPPAALCLADRECRAPASCVDTSLFTEGGSRRCLLPCCSSEDCQAVDRGLVCRPVGLTGGSVCWPAVELAERGAIGDAGPGASCLEDADCRSGVCRSARCVDSCCRDVDCSAPGDACRIATTDLAPGATWTCEPPATATEGGAVCQTNDDCRSGSCGLSLDGANFCVQPCCSSTECGDVVSPINPAKHYHLACSKVKGVRACVRVVPDTAVGQVGAGCSGDNDCRSGTCIGEGKDRYCTDMCCDDASCGDVGRFACRPLSVGGSWALRCVRR